MASNMDRVLAAVAEKALELQAAGAAILAAGAGRTIDEVTDDLVAAHRLHGFEPDHASLRELASGVISSG